MHLRRSGKSSGFLAKFNSKATLGSMVRRICITCIIAAVIWAFALIFRFNPKWQSSWGMFALWMACAAVVGAIYEWQVPDEDDSEKSTPTK